MRLVNEYDIELAFALIEEELVASMMRNMKRHRDWENDEGFQWSMWQAEQLKALSKYKKDNQKRFKQEFNKINGAIRSVIEQAREQGGMEQEIEILEAIKKGWKAPKPSKVGQTSAEFFKLNTRKLEALIKATQHDFKKAETAMLRMANDQYRKIVFNAQVYANSGAGTYEKAIDMATKDFLSRGINCIEYKNGARHTMRDYSAMAIRTATKRAYLTGEGEKRQEWGIHTVIINKRGNPCPKCLPFVGKVMIDDVWSGGKASDGSYPLLSSAIAAGLYHPNCKDSHSTYFPGVTSVKGNKFSKKEIEQIEEDYTKDQKQQYAKRQADKFSRLAEYSLDEGNRQRNKLRSASWQLDAKSAKGVVDLYRARYRFIKKMRAGVSPTPHKARVTQAVATIELLELPELTLPASYNVYKDLIEINNRAPDIEDYDLDFVFAHEATHRVDVKEYHSWKNEKFLSAIKNCEKEIYTRQVEIENWFVEGGKYEDNFAMLDIVSALSKGTFDIPFGHTVEYWQSDKNYQAQEIFANLSAIDILNLASDDIISTLIETYKEIIK